MSVKIVIIGAGSGFGGRLSLDILSRENLQDVTIALCDLHEGRLSRVLSYVQQTIDHYQLPAKVIADTDRTRLLPGADFVITSIATGGGAYYGHPYNDEIEIPRAFGIDQSVGDTTSIGAIFRFLRTGPVQLQILRDMEKYCPDALLLNHTNPMAMLCWLHGHMTSIKSVGLCHGIIGTNHIVCDYLGLDPDLARYKVAGINHLAWFLEWRHGDQDVYKLLRDKLADGDHEKTKQFLIDESVRVEIFQKFGYFPTESNRHDSEYLPYWRKNRMTREQYHLTERVLTEAFSGKRDWMPDGEGHVTYGEIVRSHEYTSGIIEGVLTDVPYRFNGNVLNTGLISNLPDGCCVEVPCFADSHGINPTSVGALPSVLAHLDHSNIVVQEQAVAAAMDRDN